MKYYVKLCFESDKKCKRCLFKMHMKKNSILKKVPFCAYFIKRTTLSKKFKIDDQ